MVRVTIRWGITDSDSVGRQATRWAALFEKLGEPVVEVTFDGDTAILERVNEAFEETFEIAGEEAVGASLEGLLVPEEEIDTAQDLNRLTKAGEIVERELRRKTPEGPHWFLLRTVPFTVEGERRAFAIYLDITERKERERELEQSQELTKALSTTFPDYTFIYNEHGDYLDVITGWEGGPNLYKPSELIGQNIEDLLEAETAARILDTIEETLWTGDLQTIEYTVETPGGTYWYEANLAPLPEGYGGQEAVIMSARDVTERKAYQRNLERQNERLEEFASVLSHDLRNPLSVAEGRLELAREAVDNEHLDAIDDALDRMETLIEDILSLAREGEPVESMEVVGLGALSQRCWRSVQTAEASLNVETGQDILANRSRLQQLLENLIRNAVEHGGEGVTVTIGDLENGFYIEDDGPGIPTENRLEVFEPGYSSKSEGTGFGLNIVREVAEAHDWSIEIGESDSGGARFEITGVTTPDE